MTKPQMSKALLRIEYSSNFVKQFKKLTPQIQRQAVRAEKLFKRDPFSSKLKTHKLSGSLHGLWAFSINYKDRIIFEFTDKRKALLQSNKLALFHKIGSHEIYRV